MSPEMQDVRYPAGLEHLRANLSSLISRGMSSAYTLSATAQVCQFPNDNELLRFTSIQQQARTAMFWQGRIEILGGQHRGSSFKKALFAELAEANAVNLSADVAIVLGMIYDGLSQTAV